MDEAIELYPDKPTRPPKVNIPREKSVVQAITKYLKTVKGLWFFNVHGGSMQAQGVPDIIGCYKGYFFWFEVKRPGGKTTQIQDRVINHITVAGGSLGSVVSSVAEVKAVLETIERIQSL